MRIAVGRLLKPHGLKGELKVSPETYDIERFFELADVVVELPGRELPLTVDEVRITSDDKVFIRFSGVADRTAAEELRDGIITVDESEAIELPEDTYFHFQLEGMLVHDRRTGKDLGHIREVIPGGSGDLYVVGSGENEVLIPAHHEFVKKVDVEAKRIEIESIPGLTEQ